jgi:thymidylate kinase/predicted nucleotidyltransferase
MKSPEMNSALPSTRLIYLAGADGTGKTSHAKVIVERLRRRGVRVRYVWFRWPALLSLPLLAYCRLRGLTRYRMVDGVRYGGWEFHRSRLVSALFPWLLLADTALASLARVHVHRWRGLTVICDRFVYDVLVDLMLAVDDERLFTRAVGRLFLRLVPKDGVSVVLDAPEATLRQRKVDLRHDDCIARRRELYLSVARAYGLQVLDTSQPMVRGQAELFRLVEDAASRSASESRKMRPVYTKTRNPLLRPLFSNPVGALLTSWVFQGLLYMDHTERWFKLAIDGVITAAVGIPVGLLSPVGLAPALVGAFLLAHTVNWLFNGQVFAVLKTFGGVRHSMDQWERYMQGLKDRIRQEPSIRWAAAYGSLARGQFSETSDLDVRIIRHPGVTDALRACWFVLTERTRAFFSGYALDVYVLDSERPLKKLRVDERPVILHGRTP